MLSLRVRKGLKQRRKTHAPCRGRAPWGYAVSEDKSRFVRDVSSWDAAREFLDILRSKGWRMHSALDLYKGPCPLNSCRAVKAWLLNPILRGGIGYHQSKTTLLYAEVVWDLHEPLISHSEFRHMLLKWKRTDANGAAMSAESRMF